MASGDMALGDTHGILAWHALHLRHLAAFCVAGGRFLCGRRGIYSLGHAALSHTTRSVPFARQAWHLQHFVGWGGPPWLQ